MGNPRWKPLIKKLASLGKYPAKRGVSLLSLTGVGRAWLGSDCGWTGWGAGGTKITLKTWVKTMALMALMFITTSSAVATTVILPAIATRNKGGRITSDTQWPKGPGSQILWANPQFPVNSTPRYIRRLLLLQISKICIIITPVCPPHCQITHHLPVFHEGRGLLGKFGCVHPYINLKSIGPCFNSGNGLWLISGFQAKCGQASGTSLWML